MKTLELKIPPPLVALCVALLMWLTVRFVGPFDVPYALRVTAALVCTLLGFGFDVAGLVSFMRAKTTANPIRPAATTFLVMTGVYRVTRNPMYLGLLLFLLGWATFLANGAAYLLLPAFVFYISRFQIVPEERALSAKFGAEFSAYQTRVRRWL